MEAASVSASAAPDWRAVGALGVALFSVSVGSIFLCSGGARDKSQCDRPQSPVHCGDRLYRAKRDSGTAPARLDKQTAGNQSTKGFRLAATADGGRLLCAVAGATGLVIYPNQRCQSFAIVYKKLPKTAEIAEKMMAMSTMSRSLLICFPIFSFRRKKRLLESFPERWNSRFSCF